LGDDGRASGRASILAAIYVALVIATPTQGERGFSSLASVRTRFDNDWGVLAGWTHYLAFDLFAGGWEVRDAQRRRIPHLLIVPALLLTFPLWARRLPAVSSAPTVCA
jgi:hypothetical protein